MSALTPFIPHPDVTERYSVRVRAPVTLTFQTACDFDIQSIPLVQLLFNLRARFMGSGRPAPAAPHRPFVEWAESLGWGKLEERTNERVVLGSACQPWMAEVKFRPIPAAEFARFDEPGLVKIAWTLETAPLDASMTELATETRVVATDATARARFLPYWRWARFGIIPIRWFALPAIRREAERRWARSGGANR